MAFSITVSLLGGVASLVSAQNWWWGWWSSSPKSTCQENVVKIENTEYCTLAEAIQAAKAGETVEIIKAREYELPETLSKAITIKGTVWENEEVIFKHTVTSVDDQIISTINESITFENVTIVLNNDNDWHHFEEADGVKITMKDCTIDWTLYVRWDMYFDWCVFKKDKSTNAGAYNIHINYWNVKFNECQFTNSQSRNVNISWWWDKVYNVEFNKTTFSHTANDTKKAAVMVHELTRKTKENGHAYWNDFSYIIAENKNYIAWKWNVIFDSETKVSSTYNETFIWGSQLFWVDTLYTDTWTPKEDPKEWTDVSYWTLDWWDVTVTVDWIKKYSTPKQNTVHKVTFDWSNEVEVKDWAKVSRPTNPTKSCNSFDWWYIGNNEYNFDSVVTSDLSLVSKWTYTCSKSSWWGGGSSKTTTTSKEDTTKEDTKVDNTKEDKTEDTATEDSNTTTSENTNTPTAEEIAKYGSEMLEAYAYAFKNWITTMDNVKDADLGWSLTRIAMAKMLSQYAINVLGKTPDTTRSATFTDVSAELDTQYNNGVSLAYQLGIMGINLENQAFRVNDTVTRAEFATALSRLLYGTADWADAYYTTHLLVLSDKGIITNTTPSLKELRGYVMLMLMRSAK